MKTKKLTEQRSERGMKGREDNVAAIYLDGGKQEEGKHLEEVRDQYYIAFPVINVFFRVFFFSFETQDYRLDGSLLGCMFLCHRFKVVLVI